jgi:hypothetical protein
VSLAPAVEGRDAVVCALGTPSPRQASSLLEDGTRNLVAAMERASVPRLVCVTLLGTADSKRNASPLYRYIILRALAPMVPDKENQERVVRDSSLEWVLIRPPRSSDAARTEYPVLERRCAAATHYRRRTEQRQCAPGLAEFRLRDVSLGPHHTLSEMVAMAPGFRGRDYRPVSAR